MDLVLRIYGLIYYIYNYGDGSVLDENVTIIIKQYIYIVVGEYNVFCVVINGLSIVFDVVIIYV